MIWTTSTPSMWTQWDWEKIISREDRNEAYLKATVRAIVAAVCETSEALNVAFPSLRVKLDRECTSSPPRAGGPLAGQDPQGAGATPSAPTTTPCSSCRSAAS